MRLLNLFGTFKNKFRIGDGLKADKVFEFDNGAAKLPKIKFNSKTNKFQFSEDGENWSDFGSGGGISSVKEDTTPEAGGEFDFGAHSAGFTAQAATGDGTTTIDWKLSNKFHFTHGAMNETFTFTAPSKPGNLLLKIKQDATGGRDCTWPATVIWLGTEPTWSDGGANKTIIMSMYYDGTNYWSQGTPWEA